MLEEIKKIMQNYSDDEIELTRETNLQTELGLSSFDYFAFVSDLQKKYDVKISNDSLMKFRTVGDIIDYIEDKKKK